MYIIFLLVFGLGLHIKNNIKFHGESKIISTAFCLNSGCLKQKASFQALHEKRDSRTFGFPLFLFFFFPSQELSSLILDQTVDIFVTVLCVSNKGVFHSFHREKVVSILCFAWGNKLTGKAKRSFSKGELTVPKYQWESQKESPTMEFECLCLHAFIFLLMCESEADFLSEPSHQ